MTNETPIEHHPHDLTADPYGWAIARLVPTLNKALHNQGTMSGREFLILDQLRALLSAEDPAIDWNSSDIHSVILRTKT